MTGKDVGLAHLVWWLRDPPTPGHYQMAACGVDLPRMRNLKPKQPRCGVCRDMMEGRLQGAWQF